MNSILVAVRTRAVCQVFRGRPVLGEFVGRHELMRPELVEPRVEVLVERRRDVDRFDGQVRLDHGERILQFHGLMPPADCMVNE